MPAINKNSPGLRRRKTIGLSLPPWNLFTWSGKDNASPFPNNSRHENKIQPKTERLWEVEVDLPNERHEYLFVADDGVWLRDPAAVVSVANPFGGYNSVIDVTQVGCS